MVLNLDSAWLHSAIQSWGSICVVKTVGCSPNELTKALETRGQFTCAHSTPIHRLRMCVFFSFPHSSAILGTNLWVRNHVRIKVAHCSIHLSTHWNCGACNQLTCQSNPVTKTLVLKVSSAAIVGPTTYNSKPTYAKFASSLPRVVGVAGWPCVKASIGVAAVV